MEYNLLFQVKQKCQGMKNGFKILILILIYNQSSFAQFDLSTMIGQYEVDMALLESKTPKTRSGSERVQKMKDDHLILMIYADDRDSSTWAAMYNMGFDPENPLWIGQCVQGEMMQFSIQLEEIYDGKQRIYHCSYATENGISELTIDPYFAHMSSEKNSGNELTFILYRR